VRNPTEDTNNFQPTTTQAENDAVPQPLQFQSTDANARRPYDAEERESYREIVYSNTVQSMRVLLEGVALMDLEISHNNKPRWDAIMAAPGLVEGDRFPPALADAVKGLWQDEGVREAFARRNELQLNDSAP